MEELLRGAQAAEIIPFDFSAPCLYFPVRHHSPACAFHLRRAIGRYRPDCILVEGPENANPLIPVLADPEGHPPLALYYSYRDSAGLLSEEKESYKCYYPFLDCSPEYIALREAAERRRRELLEGMDEVKDSLAQRRFQLRMDQAEWLEERERDLDELRSRFEEARGRYIFGQKRLLAAFPRMRSLDHKRTLERLRRWLEGR